MSKTSHLSILTLLLPVICIAMVAWMIFHEVRRMNQLHDDLIQTEKQIAFVEDMRKKLAETPQKPRFPTAEQTPREQTDFLTTMRLFSEANRVSMSKYSGTPVVPISASAPGSGPIRPLGVISIPSAIQVTGNYASVREFMYSILHSPRLFSMTDIRWARGQKWPMTSLTCTLIRYVSNQPVASSQQPAINPPPGTGMQSYPNPNSPLPPTREFAPNGVTRP